MADPRFYRRAGPFTLAELGSSAGADLAPGVDPTFVVKDVAPIDAATATDLVYCADARYLPSLAASGGACLTSNALASAVPQVCRVLTARDPRAAFATIAAMFYPMIAEMPSARAVAADARVATDVVVFPGAVIGAAAEIGRGSVVGANAVIGAGVVIGERCRIGANTTLAYCLIGNDTIIHPGTQIGQDGFGFVSGAAGHRKVPQLGRVVIGDAVEIGANCTIDRGAIADTVIGAGTKIDNLVQIGHNVRIGEKCVIVAQVGISGSCHIGSRVVIGGQAGLADHVRVADGAQIAAKSGIMRDVGPGEAVMGYPARPIRQFWRDVAALSRLTRRDKSP